MKRIRHTLFAALVALSSPVAAQTVSFATSPQGSVWNTMAGAISNAARGEGQNIIVQPFGGNAITMEALDSGIAEFTLNDANDVYKAVTGTGDYTREMPKLRIVAQINTFPVGLFVRDDSHIKSLEDLRGKRFPVGWNAFPLSIPLTQAIIATAGLSLDDVTPVLVPELIRGADEFIAGRVDTAFFAVGAPKVAEANAALGGIRYLGIDANEETLAVVRKYRPYYYFTEVSPSPVRVGITEPIQMIAWDNVLVAGEHVSDESVTAMLTTIFDRKEDIVASYPPLASISLETAYREYSGLEYHPAAVAFFESRGVEQVPQK